MPDYPAYHALIDQLLTSETADQLTSRFQEEDSLLTEKLIQILADRLSEAEDEAKPQLSWLIEWVTRLYGYKCLIAFIRLPFEEAKEYAEDRIDYLATQANYDYLDSLTAQYTDQSEEQQHLKEYQSYLAMVAAETSLFGSWPERRKIFLYGLSWLTHPVAMDFLESFSENNPKYSALIEGVSALISLCRQEGVESVVKEIDIDWLISKAQESGGEEKIGYLEQAITLLSDEPNQQWASLLVNLGAAYQKRAGGDRADNVELAIKAYEQALQVYTLQDMPYDWAASQNHLGAAYSKRISGDRAENLESAIRAYEQTLQVYTRKDMPYKWAAIQNSLGVAYSELIHGDRAENLESAIKAYEQALQVYTKQDTPYDLAMSQNNLGNAYSKRIRGDRAENLESAIKAYEQALQVYTRQNMPYEWATSQNNLGAAYRERIGGNRAENLESAIKACEQALQVYTQDMPYEWAMSQNNLGNAYSERIRGDRAENVESAIKAYEQALQVYTRQDMPYDWATSQNNLGTAYRKRILGDRAGNLESAIKAHEQALEVYTRQGMPYDWAGSQNNLGAAYRERIRGDRAENLELAIKAYEQALLVYTRQDMPYEWAAIQNNLGIAYSERICGDKAENLESAIKAYEQTLKVKTRQGMPYEWATVQNNLGAAYRERIRGDRAENLDSAIRAYEQALLVTTRQDMPYDWAAIQHNLGTAYSDRINRDRAENLESAIKAYEQTLQVRTRQDMPYEWAASQNNLGNAYRERIRGDRAENLESAIKAYEQALQVYTKDTVPMDCRITSMNLGNLLYDAQLWVAARKAFQQTHEVLELMLGESLHEESRSKIASENATLYARLIHCCLLLDDQEGAVNYALAGKSRTLTEQLAGDRKTLTDLREENPALAHDYAPIEKLRKELEELLALLMLPPVEGDTRSTEEIGLEQSNRYTRVKVLRQEINRLINNLVFTYPALSAITPLPPITQTDAQALAVSLGKIPLVEYIQHAGGWGAFVITAEAAHYVALEDDLLVRIGESLELFLNHSADGNTLFWDLSDSGKRLEDLYQAVFKPLVPYLPLSGEIVIAPTRVLHLVPFQALLSERNIFLSEAYAFTFTPSLATLRVLYERRQRSHLTEPVPDRLLNVSHSGGVENYLENVSLEAQEVDKQFADSIHLSEEEATLERVVEEANKRNYRVVHLSCHGHFLPDNSRHSGLLLAQQSMLTVNDIRVRIRLKGRPLVTLSACQTGQTLPEQGDETTGISWAFLAAGASSVVASQWSVPDTSTRELFFHFYQIRRESGVSDAEALRQAMMKVREKGAYTNRPQYWAGFHVMGLPVLSNDTYIN